MFNFNLTAAFEGSNRPYTVHLFECGCEVDIAPNQVIVFHHPPKEDLTLPLCPLWQCNHEFDNDEDSMTHYGYCTPLNIGDR